MQEEKRSHGQVKEQAHDAEPQILVLTLPSTCVILGKSLYLSEPQFACDNNFDTFYFTGGQLSL